MQSLSYNGDWLCTTFYVVSHDWRFSLDVSTLMSLIAISTTQLAEVNQDMLCGRRRKLPNGIPRGK
jgi:hypothetical protein